MMVERGGRGAETRSYVSIALWEERRRQGWVRHN